MYIILLFGDNDSVIWQEQMDWVKSIGGDLLIWVEFVIVYEQYCDLFQKVVYWLNMLDDDFEFVGWVWYQYFDDGIQYDIGQCSWLCV